MYEFGSFDLEIQVQMLPSAPRVNIPVDPASTLDDIENDDCDTGLWETWVLIKKGVKLGSTNSMT